jgi:hypothetical protein
MFRRKLMESVRTSGKHLARPNVERGSRKGSILERENYSVTFASFAGTRGGKVRT